ncbi:hypothetical protein C0431_12650 [bacterium]|nr:hypothetical protein [bacterium]
MNFEAVTYKMRQLRIGREFFSTVHETEIPFAIGLISSDDKVLSEETRMEATADEAGNVFPKEPVYEMLADKLEQ